MSSGLREIKVLSGSAHPSFAEDVCVSLGVPLAASKNFRFSDGEIGLSIEESVRGADVYLIQPTCEPVNENLMELLIMIDALRRASAHRINVVTPYFGYARQDRKTRAREPITAKLVANLLSTAGTNRMIAADLHAGQIQGFFDIPVDHLTGIPLLASYFKNKLRDEIKDRKVVTVSPDIGGVVRARNFAGHLNSELAIVDKRRAYDVANTSEVLEVIGDVDGKVAILLDDIVDTAGTLVNAAEALSAKGATAVYACATHGVLSGPAVARIKASRLQELVLTDTISIAQEKQIDKISILSIAPIFAEAIRRIHAEHSVSILFNQKRR